MDESSTIQQRSFGATFEGDRRSHELLSMAYRALQSSAVGRADPETSVQTDQGDVTGSSILQEVSA